jgi:hypothetical protein
LQALDVHCVVVEQGSWEMPDGRKIEAKSMIASLTMLRGSIAVKHSTAATYALTPALAHRTGTGHVLQRSEWSVFWSRGAETVHSTNGIWFTGKHVGEDTNRSRVDEAVGYITSKGTCSIRGIEIETARGRDTVVGYGDAEITTVCFEKSFSTTPAVAVLSQVAMDGTNGWLAFREQNCRWIP